MGSPFGSEHNPPQGVRTPFMRRRSLLPGPAGVPRLAVGGQPGKHRDPQSPPGLNRPRSRRLPSDFGVSARRSSVLAGLPIAQLPAGLSAPLANLDLDLGRARHRSRQIKAPAAPADQLRRSPLRRLVVLTSSSARTSALRPAVGPSPRLTCGARWLILSWAHSVAVARFSISTSETWRARAISWRIARPPTRHRSKRPPTHAPQSTRNFDKKSVF
jgi:hypothetical protein